MIYDDVIDRDDVTEMALILLVLKIKENINKRNPINCSLLDVTEMALILLVLKIKENIDKRNPINCSLLDTTVPLFIFTILVVLFALLIE